MSNQEQENKEIIVITGATSGLGRLTAKKCIDLGHTVIITGRSQTSLDSAKKVILKDSPQFESDLYELVIDLSDLATIKKAIKTLETFNLPSVDVVVHNAGGALAKFEQVNGNVEKTVFVNAIAPLYLNRLLLPFIEKSQNPKKRIIFLSSSLHNSKNKGGVSSPAQIIPDSVEIKDLSASRYPSIPVIAFCPGFVPTTELSRNSPFLLKLVMKYVLTNFSFTVSEEDSTDDYIYYITSNDIKTGTNYQQRKQVSSSEDSLDEAKQNSWWKFANDNIDEIISKY